MSEAKKNMLNDLKEYLNIKGVIAGEYIAEPGCYCAIGFLLHKAGNSDEELYGLESDKLISYVMNDNEINVQPLLDAGFTMLELQTLQRANDEFDEHGDHEEVSELPKVIDAMIQGCDITEFNAHRWAKNATHIFTYKKKEEQQ